MFCAIICQNCQKKHYFLFFNLLVYIFIFRTKFAVLNSEDVVFTHVNNALFIGILGAREDSLLNRNRVKWSQRDSPSQEGLPGDSLFRIPVLSPLK